MFTESTWHFAYVAYNRADQDIGLIHTVKTTAASSYVISMTPDLFRWEVEEVKTLLKIKINQNHAKLGYIIDLYRRDRESIPG